MANLDQLSYPPIAGESNLESLGHEKGIQQGALLGDLWEDTTSGFYPTSDGNIWKPPTKHPHNPKIKAHYPPMMTKESKSKG